MTRLAATRCGNKTKIRSEWKNFTLLLPTSLSASSCLPPSAPPYPPPSAYLPLPTSRSASSCFEAATPLSLSLPFRIIIVIVVDVDVAVVFVVVAVVVIVVYMDSHRQQQENYKSFNLKSQSVWD